MSTQPTVAGEAVAVVDMERPKINLASAVTPAPALKPVQVPSTVGIVIPSTSKFSFTEHQRNALLKEFARCSLPPKAEIVRIAAEIGATNERVKTWFSNHRGKVKKLSQGGQNNQIKNFAAYAAEGSHGAAGDVSLLSASQHYSSESLDGTTGGLQQMDSVSTGPPPAKFTPADMPFKEEAETNIRFLLSSRFYRPDIKANPAATLAVPNSISSADRRISSPPISNVSPFNASAPAVPPATAKPASANGPSNALQSLANVAAAAAAIVPASSATTPKQVDGQRQPSPSRSTQRRSWGDANPDESSSSKRRKVDDDDEDEVDELADDNDDERDADDDDSSPSDEADRESDAVVLADQARSHLEENMDVDDAEATSTKSSSRGGANGADGAGPSGGDGAGNGDDRDPGGAAGAAGAGSAPSASGHDGATGNDNSSSSSSSSGDKDSHSSSGSSDAGNGGQQQHASFLAPSSLHSTVKGASFAQVACLPTPQQTPSRPPSSSTTTSTSSPTSSPPESTTSGPRTYPSSMAPAHLPPRISIAQQENNDIEAAMALEMFRSPIATSAVAKASPSLPTPRAISLSAATASLRMLSESDDRDGRSEPTAFTGRDMAVLGLLELVGSC